MYIVWSSFGLRYRFRVALADISNSCHDMTLHQTQTSKVHTHSVALDALKGVHFVKGIRKVVKTRAQNKRFLSLWCVLQKLQQEHTAQHVTCQCTHPLDAHKRTRAASRTPIRDALLRGIGEVGGVDVIYGTRLQTMTVTPTTLHRTAATASA